jgi:hypothetical protein
LSTIISNYFKSFCFCQDKTNELPIEIPNPASVNENISDINNTMDDEKLYSKCYLSKTKTKDNKEYQIKKSYTIYNESNTKVNHVFIISFAKFCIYCSACLIPWWLFIVFSVSCVFSYFSINYNSKFYGCPIISKFLDSIYKRYNSYPERHLGSVFGQLSILALFLVISFSCKSGEDINVYNNSFVSLAGMSGSTLYPKLFYSCCILILIVFLFTVYIVWFVKNPGIIDTRFDDFDEILHESIVNNGSVPHRKYCKTTLVIKPLRSKFCRKTGAVVARMDHFCVFLNSCIGFNNHQLFLSYLIVSIILSVSILVLLIGYCFLYISYSNYFFYLIIFILFLFIFLLFI